MELERAIDILKNAVKNNGTTDMMHMDLTLVPADERPKYEKALMVVKLAIMEGKLSQDEFANKVNLK